MFTISQVTEILGGVLLLVAPFIARFRRGSSRWVQIASPIAGAFTELHVALTYRLQSLSIAQDPHYWSVAVQRGFVAGLAMGILLTYLLYYFCQRVSKSPTA